MAHRFSIKEVARQAGISTATVDRVIHNRANVSARTRKTVEQAIAALSRQEMQIASKGRQLFFDFVIEAPARFCKEVKAAAEAEMTTNGVAVSRPRFVTQEIMSEDEVVETLRKIAKRGSHGLCIKARDVPAVRQAVNAVVSAGIPVVTLVTDLKDTTRMSYIGLDNMSAGQTAAYLVGAKIEQDSGVVLATRSNEAFLGEEERASAFVQALSLSHPHLDVVSVSGGAGMHHGTTKHIQAVLPQIASLRAVYSMGGGNRAILDVLHANRLSPEVFVGHDLDRDNRDLLSDRKIDFLLHHDLRLDVRRVFAKFLNHHRLGHLSPASDISAVQVVTPFNVPPAVRFGAAGSLSESETSL